MAEAGADILDVGGESSRPGHERVDASEEMRRVVPVIAALHDALPDMPLSVDTTKPAVAEAALAAGAHLVNDVWGVAPDDALARVAAAHEVPIVLMHNRAEARYTNLIAEVLADLQAAIDRALRRRRRRGSGSSSIPASASARRAEHNLVLLRDLEPLGLLGRPILLGTSRKSTLGKVLDLPADGAAGGDTRDDGPRHRGRRRHRPRPRRASRTFVRPGWRMRSSGGPGGRRPSRAKEAPPERPDRAPQHAIPGQARLLRARADNACSRSRSTSSCVLNLQPAGIDDDLEKTVDYAKVYEATRQIVESTSFRLLEALAEAISHEILADFTVSEVGVRIRKPKVELGGPLDHAAVEIWRRRQAGSGA